MKFLTVYQTSNGYVAKFLNYLIFNFWEVLNFSPLTGVSRNAILFFQGLIDNRLLDVWVKFLV